MSDAAAIQPALDLLLALREKDEAGLERALLGAEKTCPAPMFAALLRTAIFFPLGSPKFYRKVRNIWVRAGRPALKTVETPLRIELLSDGTVDALAPHLELFLAAYGIRASIRVGLYDSVEHEAFAGTGAPDDATLVMLSDQWVRRHVPTVPAAAEQLDEAAKLLAGIVTGLRAKRSGLLLFGMFVESAWPSPSGRAAVAGGRVSATNVLERLNETLADRADESILLVDTQAALSLAGGSDAAGRLARIRMHALFEEAGFVGFARETASVLAAALGRSHRALLTDWDNTLWGGEVGEAGFDGIVCGPETPDGFGYHLVQAYLRDLTASGILLAAVSRNDPAMIEVLDKNPHVLLKRQHFAALALSWGDKSVSVSLIASELNFGTDLMVFMDDSHVDLVDVLFNHPQIDVILAGPDPDHTLDRLAMARYFNAARLTEGDLERSARAASLRQQRSEMASAGSRQEFLSSLEIRLDIEPLGAGNRERVLQLLHKTNQFNLTTRRHTGDDLERLLASGARIGVFSYADRFGAQGIIGLVVLVPTGDGEIEIDTWLMSCRVLNRGVEDAMLAFVLSAAAGRPVLGTYVATAKNGLVRDLYLRLGFAEISPGTGKYRKTN